MHTAAFHANDFQHVCMYIFSRTHMQSLGLRRTSYKDDDDSVAGDGQMTSFCYFLCFLRLSLCFFVSQHGLVHVDNRGFFQTGCLVYTRTV